VPILSVIVHFLRKDLKASLFYQAPFFPELFQYRFLAIQLPLKKAVFFFKSLSLYEDVVQRRNMS
jgi:hypothetical protein